MTTKRIYHLIAIALITVCITSLSYVIIVSKTPPPTVQGLPCTNFAEELPRSQESEVCFFIDLHLLYLCHYEGKSNEKFPQVLALLLHKIFSSYWGHMKALGILLKWGYGSLDSRKK